MKKHYITPTAKASAFEMESVLIPSGGSNLILDSWDQNYNPENPATDFGEIKVF